MLTRCYNPKRTSYPHYGGRGIQVCARWRADFTAFLEDVGLRPDNAFTLDRIDNNKGYEPGNVRWIDRKTQARNTRRNRRLTVKGRTQLLCEWVEQTGLPISVIQSRLREGWSDERAVLTPKRTTRQCRKGHGIPPDGLRCLICQRTYMRAWKAKARGIQLPAEEGEGED